MITTVAELQSSPGRCATPREKPRVGKKAAQRHGMVGGGAGIGRGSGGAKRRDASLAAAHRRMGGMACAMAAERKRGRVGRQRAARGVEVRPLRAQPRCQRSTWSALQAPWHGGVAGGQATEGAGRLGLQCQTVGCATLGGAACASEAGERGGRGYRRKYREVVQQGAGTEQ
jgi:hypothetical protein